MNLKRELFIIYIYKTKKKDETGESERGGTKRDILLRTSVCL